VAEILEPDDKLLLESVFKLQLDEAYQCTEGFLASTCRHGTLHFHEDFLVIKKKYVDEEKRRFHPVITDLIRSTQPIINYELDDVIIEKGECPCGSACLAIEQIEGRADDVLKMKDSEGVVVLVFPDFVRRAIITASDEVSFYSVSQVGPNTVEVYLEFDQEADREQIWKKVEPGLKSLFSGLGIDKVELLPAAKFNHDRSSKLRRVRNEYSASGQNHRSR
jgi:putative adenylate-forming enzyme